MNTDFFSALSDKPSDSVILFFNGWGCDADMFSHIEKSPVHDLFIFSDYRNLIIAQEVINSIRSYKSINLVAWSFGAWVAAYTCTEHNISLDDGIVYNATLRPIHDGKGIPKVVAYATLKNLSPQNVGKFRLRMVGGLKGLQLFEGSEPCRRKYADIRDELDFLYQNFEHPKNSSLRDSSFLFQNAVIGKQDLIIPADAQKKAWLNTGVKVNEIDAPHFCFSHFQSWDEILVC